jgi:hypothetical protein
MHTDRCGIPADRNAMPKEAEKKVIYGSLCVEIQRMWNIKCMFILVIIGVTGIVTRASDERLEATPGKHQQIHYKRQLR